MQKGGRKWGRDLEQDGGIDMIGTIKPRGNTDPITLQLESIFSEVFR